MSARNWHCFPCLLHPPSKIHTSTSSVSNALNNSQKGQRLQPAFLPTFRANSNSRLTFHTLYKHFSASMLQHESYMTHDKTSWIKYIITLLTVSKNVALAVTSCSTLFCYLISVCSCFFVKLLLYFMFQFTQFLQTPARSQIKLNATATSRLPGETAWLTAKHYKVFPL
jgi:hypothetical protein